MSDCKRDSLFGLDHTPTIDELKIFFRENDYTTAPPTYNTVKMDDAHSRLLMKAKSFIYDAWCKELKSMGGKGSLKNFSDDYPIKLLEKAEENYISGIILQSIDDEEKLSWCYDLFFTSMEQPLNDGFKSLADSLGKSPDELTDDEAMTVISHIADSFLSKMMNLTMQVQGVPELLELRQPAHEDFDQSVFFNYDKIDFERKWNHVRSKIGELLSIDDVYENCIVPKKTETTDDEVDALLNAYINSLDDSTDLEIIKLRMRGFNQAEIAERLGFKTQGAVAKRLKKLRNKFDELVK